MTGGVMTQVETIRCPNCGKPAERHYLLRPDLGQAQLVQTQCGACDYLLISCSETGRVLEAYAPGIAAHNI